MTLPTRSDLALLGRWLHARVKIQLRTGRAVVFTFAFPLVLLVLFNGLNGNAKVDAVGAAGQVPFAQFYTPSIAHLQPDDRLLHVGDHRHRHGARLTDC